MKYILAFIGIFLLGSMAQAQKPGYEIKVTFKPFKNQYIYLGYYNGKQLPIKDSVKLNDKSEAVFKGTEALGGGIYYIGYPSRDRFFEFLLDKQQHFSIIADTMDMDNKQFINSPDNDLFVSYQQHMSQRGMARSVLNNKLATATSSADSASIYKSIQYIDSGIVVYRKQLINKNPDSFLSLFLRMMSEPEAPANPVAKGKPGYDSLFAYHYMKEHYWDGLNFWDDRLSRTPSVLFEDRVDKYFKTMVYYHPDSVNKEIDHMLSFAAASEEMTKTLLLKFVNRYIRQQYMWEDAVFVHLYEKYFANNTYTWLNEQGRKTITERAYSLMANIMGKPAENMVLPDRNGKKTELYQLKSPYTLVIFYDPQCGHCKEVIPKIDSAYKAGLRAEGLQIYAVAKEAEGTRNDWLAFMDKNGLQGWTNVFYSKAEEKNRTDNGIAGYSQLYDVQSFPTIYLLDKEKRIVAKKLAWDQIISILEQRKKTDKP
jgi:thiol-disulfide isomerase/thioredoxin